MPPRHILLAVVTAAIWGFAFVVTQIGLGSFPPILLAALRFLLAGLPALFVPRPKLPWSRLISAAMLLCTVQFALIFVAMTLGMPPGMASLLVQTQAFITIIIATIVLRERPSLRTIAGLAIAALGLMLIVATIGPATRDMTWIGFVLTMIGATSWAGGNVVVRQGPAANPLHMIIWMAFISTPPLFALSALLEGPSAIVSSLSHIQLSQLGVIFYLAIVATIIAFGVWTRLLMTYPTNVVTPFALLVPVFGMASSALVLHEHFSTPRLIGGALILAGLAVITLPMTAMLRGLRLSRQPR